MAFAWRCRRAGPDLLTSFLIMLGLLWTYHGQYDFVFLFWFFALMNLRSVRAHHVVMFLLINATMASSLMFDDGPVFRAMRWGTRFCLAVLMAESAYLMWRCRGRPAGAIEDTGAVPSA
jgi:hypothetical protein